MLGGDPDDLRAHARAIRAWADDVDRDAAAVSSAVGVDWVSTAAQAFRARLADRARDTTAVAAGMREAAAKVDHLAATLESRQQTLMELLDKAGKTVADAERLVASGAHDVISAAGQLADDALDRAKVLAGAAKHGLDTVTGGLL